MNTKSLIALTVLCTLLTIPSTALAGNEAGGPAQAREPLGSPAGARPMVLWYDEPAKEWTEALPVGNGRLGAMVFGGLQKERIQFNEDTLWTGEPHDYAHAGAAEHLPADPQAALRGQAAGGRAAGRCEQFMSVPLRQMPYQPFGDLLLELPRPRRARPTTAASSTSTPASPPSRYTVGDVTLHPRGLRQLPRPGDRRPPGGRPAGPGDLHGRARPARTRTRRPRPSEATRWRSRGSVGTFDYERTEQEFESAIALRGPAARRAPTVARSTSTDDGDRRRRAPTPPRCSSPRPPATTSYRRRRRRSGRALRARRSTARRRQDATTQLREAHVADHQRLFRRVSLDLGTHATPPKLPTDERIKRVRRGRRPAAGRALLPVRPLPADRLLAAPARSRPTCRASGTSSLQPAVGQQVHDQHQHRDELLAGRGRATWPSATSRCSTCSTTWSTSGAQHGQGALRRRGWVLHHNTDLWRGTAPINASQPRHLADRRRLALPAPLGALRSSRGDKEFLARARLPGHEEAPRCSSSTSWSRIPAATGLADQRRRPTRPRTAGW